MSTDQTRPVVHTETVVEQYLGARVQRTTERHDRRRLGLRTVTLKWLDNSGPENGSHRAGTITREVIVGDAWRGTVPFEVIEPSTPVGRMDAAERRALAAANPRHDQFGRALVEAVR